MERLVTVEFGPSRSKRGDRVLVEAERLGAEPIEALRLVHLEHARRLPVHVNYGVKGAPLHRAHCLVQGARPVSANSRAAEAGSRRPCLPLNRLLVSGFS